MEADNSKKPDGLGWYYRLSEGKILYACCGVLGIDADGEAYQGHDGGLDAPYPDGQPLEKYTCDFTPEQKIEIAQWAIERWKKWGGII